MAPFVDLSYFYSRLNARFGDKRGPASVLCHSLCRYFRSGFRVAVWGSAWPCFGPLPLTAAAIFEAALGAGLRISVAPVWPSATHGQDFRRGFRCTVCGSATYLCAFCRALIPVYPLPQAGNITTWGGASPPLNTGGISNQCIIDALGATLLSKV